MNLLKWRRGKPRRANAEETPLDRYVRTADWRRNAVELVADWNHRLPPAAGVAMEAGPGLYDDPRIHWALAQHGDVAGRRVLEIGPMEASHSYMLEQAGARVDAVEASQPAFLKCLIAKELLGLETKFYLAEVNAWLRESDKSYDLAVACGVLYHMRDPVTFLELLAQKAPALFLWTHFVLEDEKDWAESSNAPYFSVDRRLGFDVRLFERSYLKPNATPGFCGGVFDNPRWMLRDDLLKTLTALGFDDVRVMGEDRSHVFGPCFSVYARRTGV